ncbi:MAG: MOSC domain-containing protein [Yoonia sp.]|nr:MOSC domain-containing protein [Yoonia sp.]
MARHAQVGRIDWIGLRSARYADVDVLAKVTVTQNGFTGDHAKLGKRAVTLIQAEHIPVISALAGANVTPEMLRRNLVVSGLNLLAIRKGFLRIGDVVIEVTGPCPPCSRMEKVIGSGGYNAMRGHGGWYAEVIVGGGIVLGAQVVPA